MMIEETYQDPRKLAAVVYDDGVAVDLLLAVFANELVRRGLRVGGVVQVPPSAGGCGPAAPRCLQDLATRELMPICRVDATEGCRFDATKLGEAAARIRKASEEDADILFVSRFGKEEARGRGFCAELARAAGRDRPVLTAVRRGLVDNWLLFNGGIGTLLEARLWVLESWWSDLSVTSRLPQAA
jgi:molybdate transport system ATP-binding protein